MSLPNSLLSYQDCLDVFERAVETPEGIRVRFSSSDDATHFRMRLHQCRRLQREQNAETYEEGHPMCGKSLFDGLTCTLRNLKSGSYVYLRHMTIHEAQIESLAEVTDEPEVFIPPKESPSITVSVQAPAVEPLKRRA